MQELLWNALQRIFTESWGILADSAPYILFGLAAAGVIKALLPEEKILAHLGKGARGAVLKASILGIPLPLCSCGVIPVAVDLRRRGAGRGASTAFLVSVPETGVDSIAISFALLGPVLAVIRPVAAFVTATVTGLLVDRLPAESPDPPKPRKACSCSGHDSCAHSASPPLLLRLAAGIRYAFGELLRDIGGWLLLGILISGVITALIPDDLAALVFAHEAWSLLVMLVIGIPLYICASASTPIAAALILKGLSPGAALVFLLAGPATNMATLTVVQRFWGKAVTAVYIATVAASSLAIGWLTNRLYEAAGWNAADAIRTLTNPAGERIGAAAGIVFLILWGTAKLAALRRRRALKEADSETAEAPCSSSCCV